MKEIIFDDDPKDYESMYTRKVQYYETDQMKIVHHSNYIRWFEEARDIFFEEIQYPYAEVEAKGIIVPVVSVSCKYKTMIRYNDIVDIYTKISKFNGVRIYFSYRIVDHDTGELRATGESSHCFLNEQSQLLRLQRSEPELYERLMNYVAV